VDLLQEKTLDILFVDLSDPFTVLERILDNSMRCAFSYVWKGGLDIDSLSDAHVQIRVQGHSQRRYIEREYVAGSAAQNHILEDGASFEAFLRCLATGLVPFEATGFNLLKLNDAAVPVVRNGERNEIPVREISWRDTERARMVEYG
jgi:hypothetical protein